MKLIIDLGAKELAALASFAQEGGIVPMIELTVENLTEEINKYLRDREARVSNEVKRT